MKKTIFKNYVSDIDKFLRDFDETHGKTPSQIKEIAKHRRIFKQRDNARPENLNDAIWEGF